MDGQDFDKLAKKLTSFASRRQALGGLLGAAAAVTGVGTVAEAKKKGKNKLAKRIPKGRGIGKSACGNQGCFICTAPLVNGQCPPNGVGLCVTGTNPGACGSGGGVCQDCTAAPAGDTCIPNSNGDGGACAVPSPQCSGNQCNVLVNGTVTCTSVEGPSACGSFSVGGAQVCAQPCPAGQTCIDNGTGYVCTTATCQATCPDGCCIGPDDPLGRPLGSCQAGGDILACGEGGSTCVSCLAVCGFEDGSCVNGECSCLTTTPEPTTTEEPTTTDAPPQTCNEDTCDGCCEDDVCIEKAEQSNGVCGRNGKPCKSCPEGKRCKGGKCKKNQSRRRGRR